MEPIFCAIDGAPPPYRDEELIRSGKAGAPPPQQLLAEIGQTESKETADDAIVEPVGAVDERSNSDEEPVFGFLGEAKKESKKNKEDSKSSKKDLKK